MRRFHHRRFATLAAAWLVAWVAVAHAEVQVQLSAHKIVKDAKGVESLSSAEEIKPGQLVEYRAVYHNDGDGGVEKLLATLPIPAGMELVAGTAAPKGPMASLDGSHFAPMPLKRKVRLADGREVERDIPVSEYRYLRWSLGNLGPKQERTVSARVRVTSTLSAETSE